VPQPSTTQQIRSSRSIAGVYKFNDVLDKAVVTAAAKGYNAVMPAPGKMMVSNFFSNLDDVVVTDQRPVANQGRAGPLRTAAHSP